MTGHTPKQHALEAFVANRLSDEGKRRIQGHLALCGICQNTLHGIREYAAMLDAVREEKTPELSWAALEQRLGPAPVTTKPSVARKGKLIALTWPALAIAATFAIAWIGISGQRHEAELAKAPAREPVLVAPKVEPAPITVSQGDVLALSTRVTNWGKPLTLGAQVHEGDALHTGAGEELHVRLSDATGIVLWQNSDLVVTRLRPNEVELSLAHGGISNVVKKLSGDARYVVRTGKIAAEVRGTRFSVEREYEIVRVGVREGRVLVSDDGKTVAELSAGQHWSNDPQATLAADRNVIGLFSSSEGWADLKLPAQSKVASWGFDGARFAASGEVMMRAPVGNVELLFEDLKGKSHVLNYQLASEGGSVSEELISEIIERDRETRVGVLEPEQIQPVVKGGIQSLKRCYEQALRREPKLEGKMILGVRVSSQGSVVRATLESQTGEPVAPNLAECITNQAGAWVFPKPVGGPVFFEVPLNLRAAQGP